MRKSVKSLAARLPSIPFFARTFLGLTRPGRFLVLCYHRVRDEPYPLFGGTPVALFRRQMETLKRHFTVLPLVEIVSLSGNSALPPNAIAITFDDGYRDNYTHAFPILRELSLPATIFVVTDAVDRNCLIWHDRVFDAFHRTTAPELRFEGATLSLGSVEQKAKALAPVLARLRRSTPKERDELIEGLLEALGIHAPDERVWEKLGWDDVREMKKGGVDFGAHTLDHPILSRVTPDEARRQIRGSREKIEAEIGSPVQAFAYPNGRFSDFDGSTRRILAEEGFACAVTTEPGANDEATDPLALRRSGMWSNEDPGLSLMRLGWDRLS